MEWISVDERLPITIDDMGNTKYMDMRVIVATKNYVSCDWFEAGNSRDFWSQFQDNGKEVTHWQPLPEPPK